MGSPVHVECSRTVAAPVTAGYDAAIEVRLTDILGGRSGLIPGIREVRDQTSWGAVGDTRRIVLNDGGTSLETLVEADAPNAFGYRITDISGAMRLLVRGIDGRFTFTPAGAGANSSDGVTITWSWDLTLTSPLARVAMPIFKRSWLPWARTALERLEPMVLARA